MLCLSSVCRFDNKGGAAEMDHLQTGQPSRVRSFPHVQGNYALHVYIPGPSIFSLFLFLPFTRRFVNELLNYILPVYIPPTSKEEVALFLKKISSLVPGLHVVDADVPLKNLCKDDHELEQVALGREFHISLGRTVPIRVHQIDSMVSMLRQKLQFQKR